MLTSDEVRAAEFSTVRVAAGYEMVEVDDLLDRLAACLAGYEQGGTGPYLTADELTAVQFTQTRLREGYRPDEVDELLDRAMEAVRAYEVLAGRQAAIAENAVAVQPPVAALPDAAQPVAPVQGAVPQQAAAVEDVAAVQQPVSSAGGVMAASPAAGFPAAPAPPAAPVDAVPAATHRGTASGPAPGSPGDYGLTVDDVVYRLQSLQAHQEAGLLDAPVQVRTPDGRTFTVAAVKSSTTGLVLTVSR
jgi:DivIVA domain-containing protein